MFILILIVMEAVACLTILVLATVRGRRALKKATEGDQVLTKHVKQWNMCEMWNMVNDRRGKEETTV